MIVVEGSGEGETDCPEAQQDSDWFTVSRTVKGAVIISGYSRFAAGF